MRWRLRDGSQTGPIDSVSRESKLAGSNRHDARWHGTVDTPARVLDWSFELLELIERYHDEDEPGIDGGLMRWKEADWGDRNQGWAYVYTINVESIDDALDRVEEYGGTVDVETMEITGVGLHAYCTDSDGNYVGVMEPTIELPQYLPIRSESDPGSVAGLARRNAGDRAMVRTDPGRLPRSGIPSRDGPHSLHAPFPARRQFGGIFSQTPRGHKIKP